jgi:competence protein ComGC
LSSGEAGYAYSAAANTEEGWLTVVNGNQHPAKWLLVSAAVPAGMLSAIAIPNFVKARGSAQKNGCISNLRQIDSAKQEWALEKKKTDTDTPSKTDLLPYLKSGKFLVCPEGGEYTINPVSMLPRCSISGHTLPEP